MKILIVDDSSTMRRIVKNCLSELNYENVLEAGDGVEAKIVLEHNKDITLALIDWKMPNMSGYELLKYIKSNDELKDIRVIMVTTKKDKMNVLMAIKAGATSYVIKPFTSSTIRERISAALI